LVGFAHSPSIPYASFTSGGNPEGTPIGLADIFVKTMFFSLEKNTLNENIVKKTVLGRESDKTQ
jgi:hypothetical protein